MASGDEGVAYWIVQKYKLSRDDFKSAGVFNTKEAAEAFRVSINEEREPAFLDGVRDFESLVDVLIKDRYWPPRVTPQSMPAQKIGA